jgi:hypothetical protein
MARIKRIYTDMKKTENNPRKSVLSVIRVLFCDCLKANAGAYDAGRDARAPKLVIVS